MHQPGHPRISVLIFGMALLVAPRAIAQELEPNNSCDQAQDVARGGLPAFLTGSLDSDNRQRDIDYYRFSAKPGAFLDLGLEGANEGQGTLAHPLVLALDSKCSRIAVSWNGNSHNAFTVPDDGIVIVAATSGCDSDQRGSEESGSYRVRLDEVQPVTISGRLVDSETSQPVTASVGLEVEDPLNCLGGWEIGAVNANSKGEFLLDTDDFGLPILAGTYFLSIFHRDYDAPQMTAFTTTPGQALDLGTIVLQSRRYIGSLSGRLIDETGVPVPGTTPPASRVCVFRGVGSFVCQTPGADGRFQFDGQASGIVAGTLYLTTLRYGYPSAKTEPFEMARFEDRDVGDLALRLPLGLPPARVGTELTLDKYGGVRTPVSVSSDAQGNSVVFWSGRSATGTALMGQLVDRRGNAVGSNFQVTQSGGTPSVSSDAAGNFVTVWSANDRSGIGVFGRRLDSKGRPVGSEFQVNSSAAGNQDFPDVVANKRGEFVVVWADASGDGSSKGISGQRFDRKGNKVGGQFTVNSYTTGIQSNPVIASDLNGGFVVAWTDYRLPSGPDVFARRFDKNAKPQGEDFMVNTYTADQQGFWISGKDIASDALGGFVVVWNSFPGQDGSSDGVFGQRFDAKGQRLGSEFQVNTFFPGGQWPMAVASDAVGNFFVTWESSLGFPGTDNSGHGIFGQLYDRLGRTCGGEILVNSTTTGSQSFPAVAANALGQFIVSWTDTKVRSQQLKIQTLSCNH